ncbi:hypothetical protein WHR41_01392 [Cladosporium halotolerans]|uniref:H-type lectin domain-containing protein n=1 Tax=Cladosporium halotolerans TaxID=1052096 RepID=A0AB34L1L1_9PEZI
MTSWIPGFGGKSSGLSWEQKQEQEAKQWHESHLGTGDEFFTHSRSPAEDSGVFKVTDVRPRPKEADRGGARLIRIPKGKYEKPPQIAKGLKSCDLSHTAKDHFQKQAVDLELEVFADTPTVLSPLIQAWRSDEGTKMIYDAEMQWLEAKQGAKDSVFLTTTFDLANGEKEKSVQFPEAFPKGTQVDVVGWMQSFRIGTEEGKDYACDFWATRINNKGFTAHADCGDNTERLTVTWIALKKGKNSVATGSFNTGSDEDAGEKSQERRGNVEFGEGVFEKAPTVLVALSQFELAGGKDLRIGVDVEDVSEEGFSWVIRTWGNDADGALHSAEASFIALGY